MIKGIYTSATAMRQGILRQELTAGNLANANTTGFKRDRLFAEEMISAEGEQSDPLQLRSSRWTDFNSGALNPTAAPMDLALQGEGFFVVSDGKSELYTRNGHFQRNAEGQLVDTLGRTVQGDGGSVAIPQGHIEISAGGLISVDGVMVDKLRVVKFENPQTLRKTTGSAFTKAPTTAPESPLDSPIVRQGYLETSNVDAVSEMVDMISTARNYEINAKMLTTQDDTLRHTVNELGRV
jgi:flagellar basal-body rod protein FlgF